MLLLERMKCSILKSPSYTQIGRRSAAVKPERDDSPQFLVFAETYLWLMTHTGMLSLQTDCDTAVYTSIKHGIHFLL